MIQNGKLAAFGTKEEVLNPPKSARNLQAVRPVAPSDETAERGAKPLMVG